jgi:predicted flap endonuclease-1-like 5' DNA nuclease
MAKLDKVEGIGAKSAKALEDAGIKDTDALLKVKQKEIADLAKKTGIPQKNIDKWIEIVDLMRIKGVGEEYSEALNRIGIDSVKEFRNRNAENTLKKLEEMLKQNPNVLRKLPTVKQITVWIANAKKLPELDVNK